ncbi:MAG: GIY-YIG nuclease family protein [Candidatus Margulisbacteria bacterium]|nr:GIY-YIG nuclease family protein [Candidatus Margulisiibacteriota bacterium]
MKVISPAYTVYILRCADGTFYTGIALDAAARLQAHNSGKGARYTRGRRPVRLVYQEGGFSRGAALRREMAIKKLPRAEKQKLIGRG